MMTKISIIKKQDTYMYKFYMLDENNKPFCVTESGFKTAEEALKKARETHETHLYVYNIANDPITKTIKKVKRFNEKTLKPFVVKNLKITDGGCKLLATASIVVVIGVVGFRAAKLIRDYKDKFAAPTEEVIEEEYYKKELITSKDCNFKDLHIILRSAKNDTTGVASVANDMLTRLGVSTEIVTSGSNLSTRVKDSIKNNKDTKIVVINLETGYENKTSNNTIIMGDSSNKRKYSSDILAACIKASLKEYSLSPYIRSGVKKNLWRNQSYLEKELNDSILINSVSQLTIDLPKTIAKDSIVRNDAAASIVEGIMRWTTIDPEERYKNIYYTTEYGDTLDSITEEYGITLDDIKKYSDVTMSKGVSVGNTVLVSTIPEVATSNYIVDNPFTTTYSNNIKEILKTYTVREGDTLTKIANKYGVKPEDIITNSENPNLITVGENVYITTYNLYETHGKSTTNEKVLTK